MQQVIKQLRRASAGLAADNRAAAFVNRARVLLVRDSEAGYNEYKADFFINLGDDDAADVAKRIASRILKGWNRLSITRVAVIPSGSDVSRIVDLDDPRHVGFSAEFTCREKPWMLEEAA